MMTDALKVVMYVVNSYDNDTRVDFLLRLRMWQEQMTEGWFALFKPLLELQFS